MFFRFESVYDNENYAHRHYGERNIEAELRRFSKNDKRQKYGYKRINGVKRARFRSAERPLRLDVKEDRKPVRDESERERVKTAANNAKKAIKLCSS